MNTIQGEGVENRYIYIIEPFVKWIVIQSTTPTSIQKEFYAPYMATYLNPWIVHCTMYIHIECNNIVIDIKVDIFLACLSVFQVQIL